MTDTVSALDLPSRVVSVHTDDAARNRLKARYAAERRFKWMGAAAIAVSAIFLVLLLSTIVRQAMPALRMNYLTLPLDLSQANVNPQDAAGADYDKIVQDALLAHFPHVTDPPGSPPRTRPHFDRLGNAPSSRRGERRCGARRDSRVSRAAG